jgi:hypothetical protein
MQKTVQNALTMPTPLPASDLERYTGESVASLAQAPLSKL